MNARKPVVVYLHRYPPEVEVQLWPALRALVEVLSPAYELVYCCMGTANGVGNPELRRNMRVIELPFAVDPSRGRDKYLKTAYWYWHLGGILRDIRALRPAAIICKETLPVIPGRIVNLGIPTIISTSDWWWSILLGHTRPGRWLAEKLERHEVRGWNRPHVRATVGSRAEGRLLERKGLARDRIVVVNASHNTRVFRPLAMRPTKSDLNLDERFKHVAICGIIRAGKGYDQLLDWWKIAVRRHPDWRLVIIGGAGGESWCRRQIARRRLDEFVHMTGWLPTQEELNRWLNGMDALIAHRRNSPDNQGIIPSVLFNSLSTGRPVVVTGLPGMAEIVRDGIDGFVFTPDDRDSFIGAIERAFADPETATRIGLAGTARACECFDPLRTAHDYRELIDRMVGAGCVADRRPVASQE